MEDQPQQIQMAVRGLSKEKVKSQQAEGVSQLATVGYFLLFFSHILLLVLHWQVAHSQITFFACLAVVEATLAFEALVYALGAFSQFFGYGFLRIAGRVRFLSNVMAWPWLFPWIAEVGCRSGAVTPSHGATILGLSTHVAGLMCGFFALREVAWLIRGEPASALDSSREAQLGDCLPSNALLGGQFRISKADFEANGRIIFDPARARSGIYVGAGLALLSHFIWGFYLLTVAWPWLLLGTICGLLGRKAGEIADATVAKRQKTKNWLWSLEGPRILCRVGEFVWLCGCVAELQMLQASPSWLAVCE